MYASLQAWISTAQCVCHIDILCIQALTRDTTSITWLTLLQSPDSARKSRRERQVTDLTELDVMEEMKKGVTHENERNESKCRSLRERIINDFYNRWKHFSGFKLYSIRFEIQKLKWLNYRLHQIKTVLKKDKKKTERHVLNPLLSLWAFGVWIMDWAFSYMSRAQLKLRSPFAAHAVKRDSSLLIAWEQWVPTDGAWCWSVCFGWEPRRNFYLEANVDNWHI